MYHIVKDKQMANKKRKMEVSDKQELAFNFIGARENMLRSADGRPFESLDKALIVEVPQRKRGELVTGE